MGRSSAKIHDFFRAELVEANLTVATGLVGDSALDAYVQAQMMMSLKVAQLREQGETASIWPDFGRFYGDRVVRLLDRAYADREYAMGLVRPFKEHPEIFFAHINDRLKTIQSIFWSGSPYFYESIGAWEARETHA